MLSIEHCSCASLYSLAKLLLAYPKRRFPRFPLLPSAPPLPHRRVSVRLSLPVARLPHQSPFFPLFFIAAAPFFLLPRKLLGVLRALRTHHDPLQLARARPRPRVLRVFRRLADLPALLSVL